jgi:hypothetical protein
VSTNGYTKRSARNELLIQALASGQSYSEAAKAAGISKSTVARRMGDPSFRAEVGAERDAYVETARRSLSAVAPAAINTLGELASGAASEAVRLGAARAVASLALGERSHVGPGVYTERDVMDLVRDLLELALRYVPVESQRPFAQEVRFFYETGRVAR